MAYMGRKRREIEKWFEGIPGGKELWKMHY